MPPTSRTRPIEEAALIAGDKNICTVVAYALITGDDYEEAESILRVNYGRRKGHGIPGETLRHALRARGYRLIPYSVDMLEVKARHAASSAGLAGRAEPRSKELKSFKKARTALTLGVHLKEWGMGQTYLVSYRRHVGVFINGINHDWTAGRNHRPIGIYRVSNPNLKRLTGGE